ncbi:MAG: hypothetical protein AAFV33_27095, partial [Chloroflexota bacterium]
MTDIRHQIKKAQTHIAAEEWAKARATLKDVDHPKAKELLAEVEVHLAEEPSGRFPMVPLIVFFSLVVVLSVSGFLLVSRSGRDVPIPVLPTLAVIPTSDCTPETVQTWWGVQNVALDTFTQDASSASRTMPGERLNERMASLRQFRADFPDPPECASSEFRMAVNDLLRTIDDTIITLEGWSDGTMDGLAVTTVLQEA